MSREASSKGCIAKERMFPKKSYGYGTYKYASLWHHARNKSLKIINKYCGRTFIIWQHLLIFSNPNIFSMFDGSSNYSIVAIFIQKEAHFPQRLFRIKLFSWKITFIQQPKRYCLKKYSRNFCWVSELDKGWKMHRCLFKNYISFEDIVYTV
jgi:hypothetical protein